jgi:hypothetical protein
VADAVLCGVDEEVRPDSAWTEGCDLLDNIFPDFFFMLLFFEGLLQPSFELLSGEHLTSFGRSVFSFDFLLTDRFPIGSRIGLFACTAGSTLLLLGDALGVQSLHGTSVLDQELSHRRRQRYDPETH